MTQREKQIKEIEFLAEDILQEYTSCYSEVDKEVLAEMIYNAGYRKQSEGVWKFNKGGSGTCSECGMTQKNVWDYDGFQRFCGCCGAKMKGG